MCQTTWLTWRDIKFWDGRGFRVVIPETAVGVGVGVEGYWFLSALQEPPSFLGLIASLIMLPSLSGKAGLEK